MARQKGNADLEVEVHYGGVREPLWDEIFRRLLRPPAPQPAVVAAAWAPPVGWPADGQRIGHLVWHWVERAA